LRLLQKIVADPQLSSEHLDALIAGVCVYFFFQLAKGFDLSTPASNHKHCPADFAGVFPVLEPGPGAILEPVAPGKSLWPGVTGRTAASLFYVGAAVAFIAGAFSALDFWKPH